MFGSDDVSEWRDDCAENSGGNYKTFEAQKGITWGGTLTPGVWSGKQTHCVAEACGTFEAWGWSQTRLDYTLKDLTLNGVTYHNVIHVTNQQTLCANTDCTSSYPPVNGGYYLVPTTGGGGYGGFIRTNYRHRTS